ncbi:conserved Plasmodium protein, unknown function [Plasmodium relictum]|uniref:Uncharacterized protein n=1 Tax=Plasmodium relictum TaxID=85471 RepID=A0A1J1H995_PLARL|nr:conserved Plasmodium protein, unknown function [Plasmodium relictum]CRH00016.1 conserved Plasmodium protein, unknown function [Plasmodium relictum]
MNKLHYIENDTVKDYEKSSFSKDEYNISEDSDKEIMVINRMLKSKIFFQSNNNNNNMNRKIIKKSTSICNTKEKFDKNKQNTYKLRKSLNNQFKKVENELYRNTTLKYEQNSFKKLEKINFKKVTENTKKKNKIEKNSDLNKNEYKIKGNEKSEIDKCDNLYMDTELVSKIEINNKCMNHNNVKNNITNNSFDKMEDRTIKQHNNCNNNEKEIGENIYKINQNNNFNYSYSYDITKKNLENNYMGKNEENNVENSSDKNIEQNINCCIEGNIEEKYYHLNNSNIYESNKNTCLQNKNENILINEVDSSMIKYDEFELEEINKELEGIIEEENNIQEQIIHLTNKELDIAIQIRKIKHNQIFMEKENEKKEYEQCIE